MSTSPPSPAPVPPVQPQPGITYTVIAPDPAHPMRPAHPAGPAQPMGPVMLGSATPRPGPGRAPMPGGPAVDPQVVRVLYAGLGLIGVGLGVSLPGPIGIGWGAFTAWAVFGVLAALVVLGAAALESARASWPLAQAAAGGLLVFWLIAIRPIAISDVGFLGTLGVAAAIAAVLLSPRRTWRLPNARPRQ